MSNALACFGCGKATQLERFRVYGPVCPTCDAKRVDKAVAERCAPLVEALQTIADGEWRPPVARKIADAALIAYDAAQGAGREM